jgi:hypothetical protein
MISVIEMLPNLSDMLTPSKILLGVSIFIVTFSVSLGVVALILIKLPATYFTEDHPRELWTDKHTIVRMAGIIGKNILGLLLVAIGIVMSLPGVPGQGLLTILLGVMLLDFPGKRRLEYRLISRPSVLNAVNRLRHRFGRPSLVLE